MFPAGLVVLRFFLGSHGTLVAVSASFMMPLRDSDIPMNVPFTFSNKQPLHPEGSDWRERFEAIDSENLGKSLGNETTAAPREGSVGVSFLAIGSSSAHDGRIWRK